MDNLKKLYFLLTDNQQKAVTLIFIFLFLSSSLQFIGLSSILIAFKIIKAQEISDLGNIINAFYNFFNFLDFLFFKKVAIFLLFVIVILSVLITFLNHIIVSYFSHSFSQKLEAKIFSFYVKCEYFFFTNDSTNRIISNFKDHIPRVTTNLVPALCNLVTSSATLLTIFIFTIFIDYELSIIIYSSLGLIYYFLFVFLKKKLISITNELIFTSKSKTKATIDAINNIKIIKFFLDKDIYLNKFYKLSSQIVKNSVKIFLIDVSPRVMLDVLLYCGMIIALIIFYDRSENVLIMDKLLFFAIAASKALPTINQLYSSVVLIKYSTISLNEVSNEIENLTIDAKKTRIQKEKIYFKKTITLKNIDFEFLGGNFKLENLNVTINKNDIIGVCGPSGSGKTTFIDLLSGIYKPKKGNLLIDDKEVSERTIDSYRDLISYVSQENYIGDLTIKEAVILGHVLNDEINLSITDEKVRDSLEKVELLNFVDQLPQNINTKLGEKGIKLSGGQKQRLTLAKAFFTQSEILILDEPTSAIDQYTEEKILDRLYSDVQKNNQTLIFISHRLKSLKKTSKIIFLENAKINFIGKYEDLIDEQGNLLRT